MNKSWPAGLLTALVTPMRNGSIETEALGQLIELQIAAGVGGLIVNGGSGEHGALSIEERKQSLASVIGKVNGRVPVIAATGTMTTEQTIELSRNAETLGATGLLVASPFGEPINWRERLAFYEALDASVSLPIMIYNTPPAGLLSFEQIVELAELKNVSAVKDSSGNPELLGDLLHWSSAKDFSVFVGKDSLLLEAMVTGARGVVFGVANCIPEKIVELLREIESNGASEKSLALWHTLRLFLRFIEKSENYVALCKVGCRYRGINVGDVRAPYLMPKQTEMDELSRFITQLK
jgi:4-hydroxy-tetrahydrodipicolinate synthase